MTDEQADELLGSSAGLHVDQMLRYAAVGTPGEVGDYLDGFPQADRGRRVHHRPPVAKPGGPAALHHLAGEANA